MADKEDGKLPLLLYTVGDVMVNVHTSCPGCVSAYQNEHVLFQERRLGRSETRHVSIFQFRCCALRINIDYLTESLNIIAISGNDQ